MQKVTTFLMFVGPVAGQAEEAITLYTSLFENSEIVHIQRRGPNEWGEAEGSVEHAVFTLNGQEFMAMDSSAGHTFNFTPSISLFVRCASEAEIDAVYAKLSEGGQVLMPLDEYPFSKKFCWLNDKYGVSWQLTLTEGNDAS